MTKKDGPKIYRYVRDRGQREGQCDGYDYSLYRKREPAVALLLLTGYWLTVPVYGSLSSRRPRYARVAARRRLGRIPI
jgi:hypothetical protein